MSLHNFDKTIANWKKWKSYHMQGLGASGGIVVLWNPLSANSHVLQQENN